MCTDYGNKFQNIHNIYHTNIQRNTMFEIDIITSYQILNQYIIYVDINSWICKQIY